MLYSRFSLVICFIHGSTFVSVPISQPTTQFTPLGSKITTDDDCSHEIKRRLFLGRKVMTKKQSTLPIKVCLVKAIVFPVVMYGCESWSIKKAERQRVDAFELWCWRRLLRVPWTAWRSTSPS